MRNFLAPTSIIVARITYLLVCELAGVEGVLRGVILIQSTMPVAVFNYLLAQTYRQGPETVAAMVVFSTLLSFLTLPLLLMVALP